MWKAHILSSGKDSVAHQPRQPVGDEVGCDEVATKVVGSEVVGNGVAGGNVVGSEVAGARDGDGV